MFVCVHVRTHFSLANYATRNFPTIKMLSDGDLLDKKKKDSCDMFFTN